MNRLYTAQVGAAVNTVNYSNNGNITWRTGLGSYTYNDTQLNAVESVMNTSGIIPLIDQDISYTGFNKASEIIEGLYDLDITYGTDNQRIKSVLRNDGNIVKTKYYSPGYEKEITAGGTRELHYINCPFGLVAILIKQGSTTSVYYTETDYLGSILGLLNANGTYAERFSYDPWGRRRNPVKWTYSGVTQPVLTDRGFTGHEHLDIFGLIDMNGRMYSTIYGDEAIKFVSDLLSIRNFSSLSLNNDNLKIVEKNFLGIKGLYKYSIYLFDVDLTREVYEKSGVVYVKLGYESTTGKWVQIASTSDLPSPFIDTEFKNSYYYSNQWVKGNITIFEDWPCRPFDSWFRGDLFFEEGGEFIFHLN
jgi:hypothetical protein